MICLEFMQFWGAQVKFHWFSVLRNHLEKSWEIRTRTEHLASTLPSSTQRLPADVQVARHELLCFAIMEPSSHCKKYEPWHQFLTAFIMKANSASKHSELRGFPTGKKTRDLSSCCELQRPSKPLGHSFCIQTPWSMAVWSTRAWPSKKWPAGQVCALRQLLTWRSTTPSWHLTTGEGGKTWHPTSVMFNQSQSSNAAAQCCTWQTR
jgi:hypothetical protein